MGAAFCLFDDVKFARTRAPGGTLGPAFRFPGKPSSVVAHVSRQNPGLAMVNYLRPAFPAPWACHRASSALFSLPWPLDQPSGI